MVFSCRTTDGQALTPRSGGVNAGLGGVVLSVGSKVTWLNTHNMAKKIEGYVDAHADFFDGHMQFWQAYDRLTPDMATLVIGERAYTESEVKAMLDELKDANRALSELRTIARRHGISLDPA